MIMNIEKAKAISDAVFVTAMEEAKESGMRQGEEKGREQGIKQGVEQGYEKASIELATNCLKLGLTIEQVSKAARLDIEVVRKLSVEQE